MAITYDAGPKPSERGLVDLSLPVMAAVRRGAGG